MKTKPKRKTASRIDDGKLLLTLHIELDTESERGHEILNIFSDFMAALSGRQWAEGMCDRMLSGIEEARKRGERHCTVTVKEEVCA